MADYIYLLENRLSGAQRASLRAVREVARTKGLTVFLVGGAVRDLTSGSPVRDLDVVVQGNALKLKKDMEKAEFVVTGESEAAQALYLTYPGGVRLELGSTLSVTFPKPGKAVMKPATILEDLRRRDFTANAMALSLNEGSYGLLMDPLNGVADIENRELRLVSNYGFIEDPVRMIRAARLMARLGWTLDEKTQTRYENGKQENYISVLSEFARGYETEEIVHEEDPLRVMRRLEAEGWMKVLAPYWNAAKVNATEIDRLRDVQAQLQIQGIFADTAAVSFPLLTSKLSVKEVATLKAGFPRQGFVQDIEGLEGQAKEFAAQLSGKGAAAASQAWRLMMASRPESVLWTAYSTKSPVLLAKFKSFSTEWPQARQKMPYVQMQEMRITPEVAGYDELLEKLFFELMDGKLGTVEEMKAFLEPYSPPAPPPPVNMRRMRAQKKEKPAKSRSKKLAAAPVEDEGESAAPDSVDPEKDVVEPAGESAAPDEVMVKPAAKKVVASKTVTPKSAHVAAVQAVAAALAPVKTAPVKMAAPVKAAAGKSVSAAPVKVAVAKSAPAKVAAAKGVGKSAPAAAKGMQKPAVKVTAKAVKASALKPGAAKKVSVKSTVPAKVQKPVAKVAAKKVVAKAVVKKVAAKKVVAVKAAKPPAKAVKVAAKKAVPAKGSVGRGAVAWLVAEGMTT